MKKYVLAAFLTALFFQSVFAIDISKYRFHVMPETSYYGGIQSIAKDSLGRMWYTGPDALFMYDGNSFYQLNDIVFAIQPKVKWGYGSVIRDKKGNLFLSTGHGLLKFDYQKFAFDLVVKGRIRSLCLHDDGKLYMLSDDTLKRYDDKTRKTDFFPLPKNQPLNNLLSLKGNVYLTQDAVLQKVDMDKKRLIPFANFGGVTNAINDALEYRGLYYFLTQRGGIHVTDAAGNLKQKISVVVAGNKTMLSKKLYIDQTGIMWVATQAGLFFYDPVKQSSSYLRMNLNDAFSLPNNSIWTIYPDPDQGVWISTYGGKIAYCSLYDSRVRYFNPSPGGLNHPVVSSFQEDHLDNIWIGTEGGGLNYWNRQTDAFSHYLKSQGNSPNSNMIKRLKFDQGSKKLAISAYSGGIGYYDMSNKVFSSTNLLSPESKQPLTVYDFVRDQQGTWWMSDPDRSFFYRKKENGPIELVRVTGADGKVLGLEVEAVFINQENQLCLVSHQGFYIVDPSSLKVLKQFLIKDTSYAANYLCSFVRAANGDLWFGTMGRGVNVLRKDGAYVNYGVAKGLAAKMVFGILEDGSQNMWLSTNDGLYVFQHQSQSFEKARFFQENSIGSFYIRSAYKTSKGEMLFGGTNGFMLFDPAFLNKNPQKPRVFFTGFLVNNNLVTAQTEQSPLTKDISSLSNEKSDKIQLSNSQSNVEIRFSANSYLSADKNQFAYRMKGLSDKWQISHANQKSVQFFNLPSGDYIFEIKASNNDGLWGDEISRLYIHVDPPFFLSWWAYCFYFASALALLFFIVRYYTNQKVFKERLALEALKEQNMRKLNQARTDFFTNISHDLKTPLTLVIQPLKQLKETLVANDSAVGYMGLIEKNVSRIQRMISQLLRFREIESQKITLNPQVGDFINFVKDLFGLFELYANKKEIETNILTYQDNLLVAFDDDVIEKILTNLFSNALKYTPNKGYVGVRIYSTTEEEKEKLTEKLDEPEMEYVSVEVLNSGDGFSEEQIATLFTSFNRLSSQRPTFEESSGLGLAIVKELVEVLNGKIWMVNKTDKISFTIVLPLKKQAGNGDMQPTVYDYTISEIDDIVMQDSTEPENGASSIRKADNILLIEDDPALRAYVEQRLAEKYNVYTASDGAEGLIKAEKIYPQLIITDLIMPNRNGLDVCRSLRQNFKTSHIPIIMISGNGDDNQNKIKALEYGASVFIDKPFDVDYLLQQTETILKNQQELKEKYSKRIQIDPSNVTVTSMDEELLRKAMKVIEENIANANYSVEDFVSDMNVGRTILYQKINDIVGMSIKEFILNIRLKRSAYLLERSDLTVAEVAYQTGFNNAKYFSVCFKKQFELSPSEFKKKTAGSLKK